MEPCMVKEWREWVALGNTPRRRILVQIISASHLTYKWESYEKSVENFRNYGSPKDSQESINKAAEVATRNGWAAGKCLQEFR